MSLVQFTMRSVSLLNLLPLLLRHLALGEAENTSLPYYGCNAEKTIQGNRTFLWRHYNDTQTDYVISEPMCLDKNGNIIVRKCSTVDNVWTPRKIPHCYRLENNSQQNHLCPEGLIEITPCKGRPFCLQVSPLSIQWNDRLCMGSNDTILDLNECERNELLKYLQTQHINSFWMPVHRANGNRYNPLVWKLSGEKYGEPFKNANYNETYDKSCLIYNVSAMFGLEMRQCDESHYAVCVFKQENLAIKSACPKNYGALSYKPNICFGIGVGDTKDSSIRHYFTNRNAIYHISNVIANFHNEYFLLMKLFETNVGSYYLMTNFKEKMKIGNGNELNQQFERKVISEKDAVVEMFLRFSPEDDALVLTVYNMNFIWKSNEDPYGIKCFTLPIARHSTLRISKKIWESDDQRKTKIKLSLYGNGTNYYWCEAHSVFNFTKVQSEGIVVSKQEQGHNFAMFFDVPCDLEKCYKVYDYENMQKFSEQIVQTLNELRKNPMEMEKFKTLKVHSVRVVYIESIEENLSKITVLCHVTASLNNKSKQADNKKVETEEDEWNTRITLRNFLSDLLKLKNGSRTSVRSTEFCFPEALQGSPHNKWTAATIGQTSTTEELCLQPNGLPIIRRCEGSFLYGAFWEKIDSQTTNCVQTNQPNAITSRLNEVNHSQRENSTEKTMKDVREIISTSVKTLIPADIFYLSKIFQGVTSDEISSETSANATILLNKTVAIIADVIRTSSSLMEVDNNVLKLSVKLNSTNVFLDKFEEIVDSSLSTSLDLLDSIVDINNSGEDFEMTNYPNDGVRVFVTPNQLVFSIDPNVANVTGIGLYKAKDTSTKIVHESVFEDNIYKFLYSNQSAKKLLESKDLQSATFVPYTLLHRLNMTTTSLPKIVIKVFANDVLFQEDRNETNIKVNGKIISISIPGISGRDLLELLPLIMRSPAVDNDTEDGCRYWNYKTWTSDGLVFQRKSSNDNDLVWCGSFHLTHFAFLVEDVKNPPTKALNLISLLGCLLSLIGVFGIFITAIMFRKWRQLNSSKILIQLSMAILLQMVIFCFVNYEDIPQQFKDTFAMCVVLGACLQYSVMAQFSWMMIIAYSQYVRYANVFRRNMPSNFPLKFIFIGWGLPLIPVAIVVALDQGSFIPFKTSDSTICYPSGKSLYLGLVLPLATVVLANFVIYTIVIFNIFQVGEQAITSAGKKMASAKIRVSVMLFFLLGLTWIFGLLASVTGELVFSYLFSLTATLQGFVMFVYFIVLDSNTISMYATFLGCQRKRQAKIPTVVASKDDI